MERPAYYRSDTLRRASLAQRRSSARRAIGWAVSLVLHAMLLLAFTGVTWFGGTGTGTGGDEREVGVVADEGGRIDEGDANLDELTRAKESLDALAQTEPPPIKPVESASLTESSSDAVEALVGIEAPAGGVTVAAGDWGAFASSGAAAGGGAASFFGLQVKGRDFVYVVDRSGSMNGQKLLEAKSEIVRSVMALKGNMRFFIIFYDHGFMPMKATGLVKATQANKRKYLTWVESVRSQGGTNPNEAMRTALALKPDAVWLLSDGLFPITSAGVIKKANATIRAQIHTIAFFDNGGEAILRRIAEENRGRFRFVAPVR